LGESDEKRASQAGSTLHSIGFMSWLKFSYPVCISLSFEWDYLV
jgi:hypothetical protein